MGCTSSASNVAESQTSTTDNLEKNMLSSEETEGQTKNENKYSCTQQEEEQKPVLPESEIISNITQVASNNNISNPDNNNSDMDTKDIQVSDPTVTNVNTINATELLQSVDNFVSLKEVVDRVILDNCEAEEQKISNSEEIQNTVVDNHVVEPIVETNDSNIDDEAESVKEDTKNSSSPTQSEDSRATRWEALADIAAELPPSLAVDPITGQIYSLTK